MLPVLPTGEQRGLLMSRQRELLTNLAPGKSTEIAKAVAQMLLGFGAGSSDEKGAKARLTTYVAALQHLPLWAVQRACNRFARGDVMPEEVGEKHLTRGFAPSTAQVHMIASKIIQHFRDEAADIREVLRARLVHRPSAAEQAKVAEGLKTLAADLALKPMPETDHDRAWRERGAYLREKRERVLGPRPAAETLTASPELLRTIAEQDARRNAIPPSKVSVD